MISPSRLLRVFSLSLLWLSLVVFVMPASAEGFSGLRDLSGKTHTLADYRGKWVIVNYWATWCPPCLEEIPDLIALHEERKDVVVIGIALDFENPGEVARFVDDNLMSYPVVLGNEKIVARIGPASVLPTTFVYNPAGQLVKTRRGLVTKKMLEKVISGQ